MRRRLRFGRWCFPLLLAGLFTTGPFTSGAQEVDAVPAASARLIFHRSTAGLSKSNSSPSNPSVRLERMLLLLKPSPARQQKLEQLLEAQQTRGNPSYHQFLTPTQFASRFAPTAADVANVVAWLRDQGFTVAALPASRGWIEFSGTVAQVQQAFGAQVKAIATEDGQMRYRFDSPAKFPAAISGSVNGLVSLDGSLSAPAASAPAELSGSAETLAALTSLSHAPALTPALAANWLHLTSLQADGLTGKGESIAIPARSNVREEDFAAFRKTFGLPESTLDVRLAGLDPGRTADEAAAMQAVSWAGAVAPDAQIILVPAASTNATDGVDLALAALIDGALAHTVSVSYSACEGGMNPAHLAFYGALYAQAAAEGIVIVAATGDSGAAACHSPLDTRPVQSGLAVNALASTPWNTALGAAAFIAGSAGSFELTAWQPSSAAEPAYATGGGFSSAYATPAWQSAAGLPDINPSSGTVLAHPRYLPDLSLPAAFQSSANAIRGLAFCLSEDSNRDGCRLVSAGGSEAATAVFSGIAAILAQKYGPQGNLAPNLYALNRYEQSSASGESSPAVADITFGGAKLNCAPGSPSCIDLGGGTGQIGFSAASGFDLATGLGSVSNVQTMVENWAIPQVTGTSPVTVEMTTPGGVTYNPSAIIALTARVLSGSGGTVPTGTVQFYDESVSSNTGTPVTLDSSGNAKYSEQGQFTVGGHNIAAIYSGDSTYKSATSQPVTINIQPSPTSLVVTASNSAPTGGSTITVTGTVVATNPGASPPTGTLTVNLDGLSQGNAPLATSGATTNASVNVIVPLAGSHSVQGIYSGDVNYNNSTSPSVTIVVAKGATVTSIAATPSTLSAGVPETFTAVLAPAVTSTAAYSITGTVSFYDGGTTLLGTAPVSSNTAILTGVLLSTTTAHTITAVYSGDANWSASVSSPLLLQPILLPVTVALTSSSPVLAPGQSATLTATVTPVNTPVITAEQHPTGNVFFYAGTTLIGEGSLVAGLGDTAVATVFVPALPAGSYVLTAQYAGDLTYGPAISNALNFAVQDFTVSCSLNNLSVVQGQTATVTCSVISLGGLSGPIQIVCAEQNPPQVGPINCTFDPTIVQSSGQTTLTIVTSSGDISQGSLNVIPEVRPGSGLGPRSKQGPPLWPAAGGGVALAFAGLLLSPVGRRAQWLRRGRVRMMALALLLAGLAGAGLGCNNSTALANNGGTPLGVHTLKITAAAYVNTVTVSHLAYITVNVTP